MINETEHKNEANLIQDVLKHKAYEYLKDSLIEAMKEEMKAIASDAVAQWAEIRLHNSPDMRGFEMNVNVTFIEHIVKTIAVENKIKVNIIQKDTQ